MRFTLLTDPLSNPKTTKNAWKGYWTASLALAPVTEGGGANLCPASTPGCTTSCLYRAGRGQMERTRKARIRRTEMWNAHPDWFLAALHADLMLLQIEAAAHGLKPACRLNVFSDIAWERYDLLDRFPDTQFYDYTKRRDRVELDNYHLTFSRSDLNWSVCQFQLSQLNRNVSAVFLNALPNAYRGWPVIDGDLHDLRWLDPSPCIVGLRAKGPAAREDHTGFVIRDHLPAT